MSAVRTLSEQEHAALRDLIARRRLETSSDVVPGRLAHLNPSRGSGRADSKERSVRSATRSLAVPAPEPAKARRRYLPKGTVEPCGVRAFTSWASEQIAPEPAVDLQARREYLAADLLRRCADDVERRIALAVAGAEVAADLDLMEHVRGIAAEVRRALR